jgi:hypothetical protein
VASSEIREMQKIRMKMDDVEGFGAPRNAGSASPGDAAEDLCIEDRDAALRPQGGARRYGD